MTLTVNEGQKATKIAEARYQKASKKHKGIILYDCVGNLLNPQILRRQYGSNAERFVPLLT